DACLVFRRDRSNRLVRRQALRQRFVQIGAQRSGRLNVERGERLVHQERRGIDDERAREGNARAHAARQLARVRVREAVEADQVDRGERALAAIDLIGLDGFANAYPRELPGGMRPRVAFSRALVVDPPPLLMDEPFPALDVETAGTLRTDLHEALAQRLPPNQSVAPVTAEHQASVV
ncbi:ATP-binding cassette domain-containing protein, partial [Burkholderia pseudomallei]|uniref:ATP-binding cassette domain-containing protein n=1 Tax=Burkholderia pseudomallei TaxID=28450 RepID=UPI003F684B81